ncbi:MAG: hypothetical protein LUE24_07615, partial [Lachnospiraceae bacterium]|nr:hypothetical protein [Lachnospiraceae bacterium]
EVKADVVELKEDVANLKVGVAGLKADMVGIRLTIDNELRVNIRRVAEGHLDLVRHLKEAGRKDSEVEMLTVRVNVLERDVRELQHQFA